MKATIQKWGNSLAIRIPKSITKDTRVSEGSNIDIMIENGKIVLSPIKKEYSLKELLKNITIENIHSEISTGDQTGGEIW
ncbi:MAG: AbrB/MazE/SpoVT family DNA-binding domain-containing protein [Ignavibacteriales bacterium]|nr:MAG: AbrB/MazE/SpoVT family DNA-binding domain-containing protein [Ignavibacteriales bacterium]